MMQCGTYWSGCSQSPQRRETREDKMKERSHGTPYFQDTTANVQVMQLSVAAGSGSAAAADELAFLHGNHLSVSPACDLERSLVVKPVANCGVCSLFAKQGHYTGAMR